MHEGFRKDNTLAYWDGKETEEERNARKEDEIERSREDEVEAAVVRREKLTAMVVKQNEQIGMAAMKVTEDDFEIIHGEQEYKQFIQAHKCCQGAKYVDPDLDDPRAQLWFVLRALIPVMLGYIPTFFYSAAIIHFDEMRAYFYIRSPTYALITSCSWIGLNIFGRMIRHPKLIVPLFLMRSAAISHCFAAFQMYLEYIIWELIYVDPPDINYPSVAEMEQRLRKRGIPESWLNFSSSGKVEDLTQHTMFSRAYFGPLLAFSFFLPAFSIIVGLLVCAGRKELTKDNVTGDWIKRTGAIAGILPSLVFFLLIYLFEFTSGPRSFDFGQIYACLFVSLAFGILVSFFWQSLFAGESWFNVWKDDYLYFGYTYSI